MYDWQKENIHQTPSRSLKFQNSERLNFSHISRTGTINRTTFNHYKESTGQYFQAGHKDSFLSDSNCFEQKLKIFENTLDDYTANGTKKHLNTVRNFYS
jgi:hypothetical protein